MRDAITGHYTTRVRDMLFETVFLGAGDEVRISIEDGSKLAFVIYLGSCRSAQVGTVGTAIKHLNKKAPELVDEAALSRLHAAVAILKDRAARGEQSEHYRLFKALRQGNEMVNAAIKTEYEDKGIQHMRWGGAVVEIVGTERNRLGAQITTLRFYNGSTVSVNAQSLVNQED